MTAFGGHFIATRGAAGTPASGLEGPGTLTVSPAGLTFAGHRPRWALIHGAAFAVALPVTGVALMAAMTQWAHATGGLLRPFVALGAVVLVSVFVAVRALLRRVVRPVAFETTVGWSYVLSARAAGLERIELVTTALEVQGVTVFESTERARLLDAYERAVCGAELREVPAGTAVATEVGAARTTQDRPRAPARAIPIEEPATGEVPRGRADQAHRALTEGELVTPVELAYEVSGHAPAHEELPDPARGHEQHSELGHAQRRRAIEVVVVIVRVEHRIEPRELGEGQRVREEPAWTGAAHGPAAVGPHRIAEEALALELDEDRRVPQPRRADSVRRRRVEGGARQRRKREQSARNSLTAAEDEARVFFAAHAAASYGAMLGRASALSGVHCPSAKRRRRTRWSMGLRSVP